MVVQFVRHIWSGRFFVVAHCAHTNRWLQLIRYHIDDTEHVIYIGTRLSTTIFYSDAKNGLLHVNSIVTLQSAIIHLENVCRWFRWATLAD